MIKTIKINTYKEFIGKDKFQISMELEKQSNWDIRLFVNGIENPRPLNSLHKKTIALIIK